MRERLRAQRQAALHWRVPMAEVSESMIRIALANPEYMNERYNLPPEGWGIFEEPRGDNPLADVVPAKPKAKTFPRVVVRVAARR